MWTNSDGTQFDVYYQDVAVAGTVPANLTASLHGDQFLQDVDRGSVVLTHTKPGAASSRHPPHRRHHRPDVNIASGGSTVNFAASGDVERVVSSSGITTQYDIDLVDRSTDSSPGMPDHLDAAAQRFPRVSGNVVVYEDYGANAERRVGLPACRITTRPHRPSRRHAAGTPPRHRRRPTSSTSARTAAGGDQIFLYDVSAGADDAADQRRQQEGARRASRATTSSGAIAASGAGVRHL